jgi:hypothetical protein
MRRADAWHAVEIRLDGKLKILQKGPCSSSESKNRIRLMSRVRLLLPSRSHNSVALILLDPIFSTFADWKMQSNLDPALIYFTNSKIRQRFSNQKPLQETLDALVKNEITVHDIPRIRVIQDPISGKYYSMNNRRLYVFKQLRSLGLLTEVPVELRVANTRNEARFATQTLSLQAKVCMK